MPRAKLNDQYITADKLRTFEGFEHITDEEADQICEFTIQLCQLAYQAYQTKKSRQSHEGSTKRVSKICKS